MATFPIREAEIVALVRSVIGGLSSDSEIGQGSPVSVDELEAVLGEYDEVREAATKATAHSILCTKAKNSVVQRMARSVKRVLRHAEDVTGNDHDRLRNLGWGAPREPVPLPEPGQPLGFRIVKEGRDSITLAWKKPPDGGKVAAYRIERQRMGEDEWTVVGLAVRTRVTLERQEAGVVWMYRAVAVNRAGEGIPSNPVKAVL